MNPTLSYLLGKRMWWISGVSVWGSVSSFEPRFVITEWEGAQKRIVYTSAALGGNTQRIEYANLIDAKGNRLPEELINPRVVPITKGNIGVVVQGSEGPKSFALGKTVDSDQLAVADLLVIEMG